MKKRTPFMHNETVPYNSRFTCDRCGNDLTDSIHKDPVICDACGHSYSMEPNFVSELKDSMCCPTCGGREFDFITLYHARCKYCSNTYAIVSEQPEGINKFGVTFDEACDNLNRFLKAIT